MIELADTSAWVVARRDATVRREFDERLERFEIATCDMVKLELLYSARDATEFSGVRSELEALPQCRIDPDVWSRAIDVYERLAELGGTHQRSVKHADLLIAAAAEAAGCGVLHYDSDYERIGSITGQPVRWIAERSSIRSVAKPRPSR